MGGIRNSLLGLMGAFVLNGCTAPEPTYFEENMHAAIMANRSATCGEMNNGSKYCIRVGSYVLEDDLFGVPMNVETMFKAYERDDGEKEFYLVIIPASRMGAFVIGHYTKDGKFDDQVDFYRRYDWEHYVGFAASLADGRPQLKAGELDKGQQMYEKQKLDFYMEIVGDGKPLIGA